MMREARMAKSNGDHVVSLAAVGLTVSGVGLFLLVAGVALQLGAIALTPNPVQKWMRRSYFGQDKLYFFGHFGGGQPDDSFTKGWQEEFEELLKAFGTSFEQVQKEDAERKAVAAAKKA
jgi:hypothetical protein